MCARFAEMETKLGEIDRARAIYIHASQMCDPRWETISSFKFHVFMFPIFQGDGRFLADMERV